MSADEKSNINHPSAKFLNVIANLMIVVIYILYRLFTNRDFPANILWIFICLLYVFRILDFRSKRRQLFLSKILIILIVMLAPLINVKNIGIGSLPGINLINEILSNAIRLDSIIIIFFIINAIFSLNKIYSIEIIWLSKKIPSKPSKFLIVVITTYYVTRRFFTQGIQEILEAAKFKVKLAKDLFFLKKISVFIGAIVHQLLPLANMITTTTESILRERNFINTNKAGEQYTILSKMTKEDYVSIIGCTSLMIIVFSLSFLV